MNHTILDYLSFTGSPELLLRCREMAKQRFSLEKRKDPACPTYNVVGQQVHAQEIEAKHQLEEQTQVGYMAENIANVLGCTERNDFVNSDLYFEALDQILADANFDSSEAVSFNECYQSLIVNLGIDMLDCLCHAQVEEFISLLNEELTFEGNVWTIQGTGRGWSGYQHSSKLLVNGKQAGLVAWGAKNFGFYVSFSGVGCSAIDMKKLHAALSQMLGVQLTRVDIAYDDYEGHLKVEDIREKYLNGEFVTRGKPPGYGYFEGGELVKQGDTKKYGMIPSKGRSFYVGQRVNGKLFRGYEKGKQLQCDKYPNWFRAELELHNKSRVLPLDIIVNPDTYFVGAYPALVGMFMCGHTTAIKTVRNTVRTNAENAITHATKQYGKLINFMVNVLEMKPQDIINRFTKELAFNEIPERLNVPVVQDLLRCKSGETLCLN